MCWSKQLRHYKNRLLQVMLHLLLCLKIARTTHSVSLDLGPSIYITALFYVGRLEPKQFEGGAKELPPETQDLTLPQSLVTF